MTQINKYINLIKVMFNNLILSTREKYLFRGGVRSERNITFSHSFVLPLILSKLNLPDGASQPEIPVITSYYLAVFLLSLISLLCFIHILGYFLSMYLVERYDIEKKYPKLKRVIKYYDRSGLFFVILESIMAILTLFFLSLSALILYVKDLV